MTKEIQQETIRGIALRAKALGGRAMLVGGCVRDALTGRGSADIDCEVYGLAPQALRSLAAEFGEVDESGARYGIFSLKGAGIDLAVPRLERRTGPKHGDFDVRLDPALPFARAAARRDFTVNAILRDALTGEIVDPFGGQEDLRSGVLRCVGDPARRFAEDALRILRLLRFASVLGFSIEENTARAARERRDGLRAIAHERVYAELNTLLCGEHVAAVLLEYPDILGVVLPEILPCVGFDQRNPHHCYDVWEHTARAVGAAPPTRVLRWTMLLHDLGKPKCFTQDANGIGHFYGHTAASAEMAEEIMARLRFEHTLAQGVRAQLACFDEMFPPERAAVHRMMARYGRETMWNLLQTKLADNAAKAPDGLEQAQKPWCEALLLYNELLAENACCSLAELRIGGGELLAIGFSGRAVGRAKQRLLDEVASERLANEHGALVRRAERLYRSGWRGETDGRE